MTQRFRLLTHWPLIFAAAFAAFAIPLLWSLHSSQTNLKSAIDARLVSDVQQRAQTISDFIGDLRQTAIDLASSQEIESYLTNRALGMSARYGLNTNLDLIKRYFERRVYQATLRSKPIYRSVSFFDQDGSLLAKFGNAKQPNGSAVPFEPAVTILNDTLGARVVSSSPVTFKGSFAGSVVIEIEPGVLSRLLVSEQSSFGTHSGYQEILLTSDGASIVVDEHPAFTKEVGLKLLAHVNERKANEINSRDRHGLAGDLIGLRKNIDGTPLSLFSLQPRAQVYGQLASPVYIYVFAGLSLVVFLAACVIEMMRRRTAVLETEYNESARHGNELRTHNELLRTEIRKREVVESQLHQKTEELAKLNSDLRIAAAAFDAQDAMIITDSSKRILRVNKAFCEMTGYSTEDVVGRRPDALNSRGFTAEFLSEMWEAVSHTGSWQGEIVDETKAGNGYTRWLTVSSVRDENNQATNFIGTYYDLSERKKAEQRIKELAFFDQLTGLPNRALLLDRAKQVIFENGRAQQYSALLFIDLDNFKILNDTLGHDVGDLQLKQVAERLKDCVRSEDTVARFGGDEFVVLLPRLGADESKAALASETVAEKILLALGEIYHLAGYDHNASCSIGVTIFGSVDQGVDELLKRADLAMYEAKGAGRNAIRFFDPGMQRLVAERSKTELELRDALKRREFSIFLQPQVNSTNQVVGAEALLRWQHPIRGIVLPSDFIPVAESSGLIVPIGSIVLEAACRQIVAWSDRSDRCELTIAVNVSAAQIHHAGFVENVLEIIDRTGADPRRLKLELTESLLVRNIDDIIGKMKILQSKGLSFSLDDFGTGYSSLSYLKRLPLDQLKIDREFVKDILTDPNDAAIARMIVALGRSLELDVIAEGVETQAQQDYLEGLGCLSYQGYLFGRPMDILEFEDVADRLRPNGCDLDGLDGDAVCLPRIDDEAIAIVPITIPLSLRLCRSK